MSRRALWMILAVGLAGAAISRRLWPLVETYSRRVALERFRLRGAPPRTTLRPDADVVSRSVAEGEVKLPLMLPTLATIPLATMPLAAMPLDAVEPKAEAQSVPAVALGPAATGPSFGEPPREQPAPPAAPPPPRRSSTIVLATLAAGVGVIALALGAWSAYLAARSDASDSNELLDGAVALLADPSTQRFRFDGSGNGLTIVVGRDGAAMLVVTGLKSEPTGMSYQAWVIGSAGKPVPAGVFSGDARVVALERRVPSGATVAITVEPEGGSAEPSHSPKIVARLS